MDGCRKILEVVNKTDSCVIHVNMEVEIDGVRRMNFIYFPTE